MEFITAQRIHNGHEWMPEHTVLEVAEDGTIMAIRQDPAPITEYHGGVIVPGFVNAHCHLELSHMRGVAEERTGLIPFLKSIPTLRNTFSDEQKKEARHRAFDAMYRNGIVAVGDIANTPDAADLRAQDRMHFHTFVEALGFTDGGAGRAMGYATMTHEAYAGQQPGNHQLRQSITPHAPYSVSASLFRLIDQHTKGSLISIHNQESDEENKYYMEKDGTVGELLAVLGIDDSAFVATGRLSLESYLRWMSADHPFLFVHNTASTREDVRHAMAFARETYWCLCPNANLYIENRLPDIDMLIDEGANICIGTDSLASNYELSMLAELQTLRNYYPHIQWETLFRWATAGGAQALQMADLVGTLEVGKKPGLLWLQGLDTRDVTLKRIV